MRILPKSYKVWQLQKQVFRQLIDGHVEEEVTGEDDAEGKYLHKKFKKVAVLVEEGGRHTCPYCKISCAKPSVLQKHIRAHTNERPYPCQACGFAFKTKSNLYKHRRSRAHSLMAGEASEAEDPEDKSSAPPPPVPAPETERPKPIYKPKFHKAALYQKEEEARVPPSVSAPQSPNVVSKSPASPSPEFIQQHISKLISKNQEIVETTDPQWPKKFQQRQGREYAPEELPGSPLSRASSPGVDASVAWPKKFLTRQMSVATASPTAYSEVPKKKQVPSAVASRLALALLRPENVSTLLMPDGSAPVSPDASAAMQPLNLCTNSGKKRTFSESMAGSASSSARSVIFPNSYLAAVKDTENVMLVEPGKYSSQNLMYQENTKRGPTSLEDLASSTLRNFLGDKLHPQNPEGSIIKDLLLRSQAGIQSVCTVPENYNFSHSDTVLPKNVAVIRRSEQYRTSEELYASHIVQFVCQYCKIVFRSAETLETHYSYYCKMKPSSRESESPAVSPRQSPAPYSSPGTGNSEESGSGASYKSALSLQPLSVIAQSSLKASKDVRLNISNAGGKPMSVVPPYLSPGPLLGSTPLVECYPPQEFKKKEEIESEELERHRNSIPKKRRLDSESSTASSPDVRTLSSTPTTNFAMHSATTLRSLEELSKYPMRPNSLQMFGGEVQINEEGRESKTMRIEPSNLGGKSPCHNNADLIIGPWQMSHSGALVERGENDQNINSKSENSSPHIMTIARAGLHSGGTLVQVPQKPSSGPIIVQNSRSSGGSVNCIKIPSPKPAMQVAKSVTKNNISGGIILNTPSHSPVPASPSVTQASFADSSQLVASDISKVNAASPVLPHTNISHHLPYMHFALNPLTHITAYNPLTLPHPANLLPNTGSNIVNVTSSLPPQEKDKKSLSAVPPSQESLSPYSGGIVTIYHAGKVIPYVPGMPGPHSLLQTTPISRKHASPKPLDLASTTVASSKSSDIMRKQQDMASCKTSKPQVNASLTSSGSGSESGQCVQIKSKFHEDSSSNQNVIIKMNKSSIPVAKVHPAQQLPYPTKKCLGDYVSAKSLPVKQQPFPCKNAKLIKPDILITNAKSESYDKAEESNSKQDTSYDVTSKPTEEVNTNAKSDTSKPKFLRPTSLPLKPGTFTPKKHHAGLTPTGTVLSLVSPETPRPKKSYGQLYLNGHAYTYLGLKCSTRAYFCTLNRPQPMYVPQSSEHPKISMYSNWKVCSEADPNPFGLDPGQAMSYYDSRHRPTMYTIAKPSEKLPMIVTHSSYWLNKHHESKKVIKKEDESVIDKVQNQTMLKASSETPTGDQIPKRVKLFDGGFESNEEYTYVRGRGRGRFVCEECGIRCKKPSMLKKHIRTHTDVRPFTCKHCNFSFKTKGNLTKHMKSKAHYKKCVELGISPVPTVVDDSYIDEECLAKQQALRASRQEGNTDSDDDDEDEDEEDEEEEEEEESGQTAEDGDGTAKGRLEHEAVQSLLSLYESTPLNISSAQTQYISDGLLPVSSSSARPNTYPYNLTLPGSSSNESPTLGAISAQTEREKVSHNTGLALELRSSMESEESDATCHRGTAASVVLMPPQRECNRYYFPSCRSSTLTTNVCVKSSADVKNWVDSGSTSDDYNDADISGSGKSDEDECNDYGKTEKKKHISDKTYTPFSSSVLQVQLPMDLSNKPIPARKLSSSSSSSSVVVPCMPSVIINGARTPTTPISEILTPVSEPAFLLASLCSSMERIPTNNSLLAQKGPDPAEATMLQAYLTEKALQDARMKQHQYHHNNIYTSAQLSNTAPVLPTGRITPLRTIVSEKELNCKDLSYMTVNKTKYFPMQEEPIQEQTENSPAKVPRMADVDLKDRAPKHTMQATTWESNANSNFSSIERSKPKDSSSFNKSSVSEHSSPLSMQSTNSSIVRNVTVGSKAFGAPPPSPTPNSPGISVGLASSKPKAEFLHPSSGPSSSYASVTEDGRSVCGICNKVFSKPSQLRLHVNIHYFERPFRCEPCAVSFRTKGHLQKHERSVTHQNKVSMNSTFGTPTTANPRPFKCDDCKIAFRIHGHLAKHLRSKMHIMRLECMGKLPFGTYAEMEREGISLNEIDTTDCENSLESLQVLAQKLIEKDPSKLGQWDAERGEVLVLHPNLSGGETSSDEGEPLPLPNCSSPSTDESGSSMKEQSLQNSTKTEDSLGNKLLISPQKSLTSKDILFNKRKLLSPVSECKSSSKEPMTDPQNLEQSVPPMKFIPKTVATDSYHNVQSEKFTSGSFLDPKSSSQNNWPSNKESSGHDGNSQRLPNSSECDYEDTSDADSEKGSKVKYSCATCRQTYPSPEALQVHSFVEHNASVDMPQQCDKLLSSEDAQTKTCSFSQFSKRLKMTEDEIKTGNGAKSSGISGENVQVKDLMFLPSSKLMGITREPETSGVSTIRVPINSSQMDTNVVNSDSTSLQNNGDKLCQKETMHETDIEDTSAKRKGSDVPSVSGVNEDRTQSENVVAYQKVLTCDLCGKPQTSQELLQKHLLSHTQPRPFVCEFCDAGFISQSLLQSHLKMHQQS